MDPEVKQVGQQRRGRAKGKGEGEGACVATHALGSSLQAIDEVRRKTQDTQARLQMAEHQKANKARENRKRELTLQVRGGESSHARVRVWPKLAI